MKLSAVVIAKNEAHQIKECLDALAFCDERIVVDSGSTDRTAEIAKHAGAAVYLKPFVDFASQKNFGIQKVSGNWVLLVDADERVSPELAAEIRAVLQNPHKKGYLLLRRNQIFGRWMRHGINSRDYQLRLVEKLCAEFKGAVHERITLQKNETGALKKPLYHYSTARVSQYMNKLNLYSRYEAELLHDHKEAFSLRKAKSRPLAVWFHQGVLRAGLLDGIEGFFFCVLGAYYEFIRRVKLWEIDEKTKIS